MVWTDVMIAFDAMLKFSVLMAGAFVMWVALIALLGLLWGLYLYLIERISE
jgi:hypothetical protein